MVLPFFHPRFISLIPCSIYESSETPVMVFGGIHDGVGSDSVCFYVSFVALLAAVSAVFPMVRKTQSLISQMNHRTLQNTTSFHKFFLYNIYFYKISISLLSVKLNLLSLHLISSNFCLISLNNAFSLLFDIIFFIYSLPFLITSLFNCSKLII